MKLDKTILITGGAGYLGSAVIDRLSLAPCKITVLDIADTAFKRVAGQAADISFKCADIRDKDAWPDLLRDIDIVFHFAAQTSSKIANENVAEKLSELKK